MSLGFVKASLSADTYFKRFVGCVAVFVGVGDIKWVNCTFRAGQIVAASSISVRAVFDCALPELFPAGSFDSVFSGLLRDLCRSLCDQAV